MKKSIVLAALLSCVCVLSIHGQNVSRNCYRGFIDAGYAIGIGDYEFGRFEVNTSQGQVYKSYKHGLYSSPNQI